MSFNQPPGYSPQGQPYPPQGQPYAPQGQPYPQPPAYGQPAPAYGQPGTPMPGYAPAPQAPTQQHRALWILGIVLTVLGGILALVTIVQAITTSSKAPAGMDAAMTAGYVIGVLLAVLLRCVPLLAGIVLLVRSRRR